ncbi:MAG TPA: TetR family transcriptional regulator [Marmoricola sp.]
MARSYGGVSAEERVAERRARLVAAGREVLAETGWQGTSLRAVCARSGLADRYFYESFATRDALLVAVCEQVMTETLLVAGERMAAAPQTYRGRVRAAADAVLDLLDRDTGLVRVLLLETPDTPVLNEQRRTMMGSLVDLLVLATMDLDSLRGASDARRRLGAHAVLGALFELLTAWTAGEIELPREELLDFVVHVAVSLAAPA